MDATTIAIDLAKDVFEVAIARARGPVEHRRLSRRQFASFVDALSSETTVLMEACGTAHYWGRRCESRGARVRMLPAQYVRPYVRRNKTDRADADALLEAHRAADIHPVPIKTLEQQAMQSLHRVRAQWQATRIARLNIIRAIAREFGAPLARGTVAFRRRVTMLLDDPALAMPAFLRGELDTLLDEVQQLEMRIADVDRHLARIARQHPIASRLLQIPGIGVLTATALVGSVPHIHGFRRGRQFASWLGLTPRESSSGTRYTRGGISKRGDVYLRCLLAHGSRAVLRAALHRPAMQLTRFEQWALAPAERRGRNRATMAIANKLARFIWAVWTREEDFEVQRRVA
jgi:transposase